MIVEDDKPIFECLRELLELEGYQVTGASHGKDALQKLEKNENDPPDVILLDLMMPVMDGFQFRENQKLNSKISNIPVIVMTAGGCSEANKKELGIKAFLKKPFELSKVLKLIDTQVC